MEKHGRLDRVRKVWCRSEADSRAANVLEWCGRHSSCISRVSNRALQVPATAPRYSRNSHTSARRMGRSRQPWFSSHSLQVRSVAPLMSTVWPLSIQWGNCLDAVYAYVHIFTSSQVVHREASLFPLDMFYHSTPLVVSQTEASSSRRGFSKAWKSVCSVNTLCTTTASALSTLWAICSGVQDSL